MQIINFLAKEHCTGVENAAARNYTRHTTLHPSYFDYSEMTAQTLDRHTQPLPTSVTASELQTSLARNTA